MRWGAGMAFALLTLSASPARADEAADLKAKGDAALVGGNAADALVSYRDAYAKNHDPALLYNMGRAQQILGDIPAAVDAYEEFDRAATPELRARVPGLVGLLKDLRGKVGQVVVSCNVEGATVSMKGRPIGKTPLSTTTRVLAGKTTVEVTKDGYFPYKTELDLQGGALSSVTAKLFSKAEAGVLVVTSATVGVVVVVVDGTSRGNAPTESVVDVGAHRVDVTLAGYKPASSSFGIGPGEKKTLNLTLEKESALYEKWWFWTGIGVVVAGGVVATLLSTRTGDARGGTIAPGQIPAALRF